MKKEILARANALEEKIIKLENYLEFYAMPSASCHRIKIIPRLKKIIAFILKKMLPVVALYTSIRFFHILILCPMVM